MNKLLSNFFSGMSHKDMFPLIKINQESPQGQCEVGSLQ